METGGGIFACDKVLGALLAFSEHGLGTLHPAVCEVVLPMDGLPWVLPDFQMSHGTFFFVCLF